MKYKVVKKFPKGLEVGEVLSSRTDNWYQNKYGMICYKKDEVESSPEFFAPYILTTHDKVDMYENEKVITVYGKHITGEWTVNSSVQFSSDTLFFSTKQEAEKYIASLKPKFVENEWLFYKCGEEEFIFRYNGKKDDGSWLTTEAYGKEMYGTIKCIKNIASMFFRNRWADDKITKASVEQITSILTMVALHKGFKEGVKFKSAYSGSVYTANLPIFTYSESSDGLYNNSAIYWQGKWAEILPQESPIVVPQDYPCVYTKVIAPNTLSVNLLGSEYEITSVGFDKNEVKINYQVK